MFARLKYELGLEGSARRRGIVKTCVSSTFESSVSISHTNHLVLFLLFQFPVSDE